jgi:ATP diphosphatase
MYDFAAAIDVTADGRRRVARDGSDNTNKRGPAPKVTRLAGGLKASLASEKAARGQTSALDDIPLSLPALARAAKLGRRASRVGFDWPDTSGVLAKIVEEVGELQEAVASGVATDTEAELGDVLFAVVNLARHLGVDPEAALRGTNQRFEQRFRGVEQKLAAEGVTVAEAGLERANAAWDAVKRELK